MQRAIFIALPNNDKMTGLESWLVWLLLVGFLFMIADNLMALAQSYVWKEEEMG